MKLYIIVIDEVYDYQQYRHAPVIRLTKDEASKELVRLRNEVLRNYENDLGEGMRDSYTKGESFEVYLDGEYSVTHYNATIHEVEVDGIKKTGSFLLRLACGEQCSRFVGDNGWVKAQKALDKGSFDGSIDEYTFETENDRDKAINIIEQYDGWLDHYYDTKSPVKEEVAKAFRSFELMSEDQRKEITDSNLLPSETVVAKGATINGVSFIIRTQGEVRINWKGEIYKYRKDFPDDLVEAITCGKVEDEGGEFIENNWYELTIFSNTDKCLKSDLFDIDLSDLTEGELKGLVLEEIRSVTHNQ